MSPRTIDCETMKEVIVRGAFWLDGFEGKSHSGYFYRSNISQAVKDFEEKFKRKVVGIKLDPEGGLNVEFILEVMEDEQ